MIYDQKDYEPLVRCKSKYPPSNLIELGTNIRFIVRFHGKTCRKVTEWEFFSKIMKIWDSDLMGEKVIECDENTVDFHGCIKR